jgi:hypothetical protein
LALANAADAASPQFFGAANEISVDADGWAVIPFGDSGHSGKDSMKLANGAEKVAPVLQRFDRTAAEELVADFKSAWSRLKRAVVGLPIFKGHPDAPRWAARFPDKSPRGTIADMEVRSAGLAVKPVLTEQGATEVGAGWSAFSPFWNCRLRGEENGVRIFSPCKLFSIGLLPPGRENIPGLSLANAAEPPEAMNPHLIRLLAAMGIQLAADANDDTAKSGVDQALTRFSAANAAETQLVTIQAEKTALEGQLTAASAAKTALEGEKTSLANAKTGLETQLATANTTLKTERTARARLIVGAAVQAGRIQAAQHDAQVTALANATDFDTEAQRIQALQPRLKTGSALANLGREGNDARDRQTQVIALVNARMEEPDMKSMPQHQRYDAAFAAVQKDPKHAALFAAMKKPDSAA